MSRTIARAAAVTATALLVSAGALPAAQADTRTFQDKGAHLTTVKVQHGAGELKVAAVVGPYRIGSYFTFWLDADPGNSGPEYKTDVYPNSDGPLVERVGSFTDIGTGIRCQGFRATADVWGPQVVTITVPRSCIDRPSKVRVAVRAYYDVPGPNVVDWGPGRRQFFGWVNR